MDIPLRRINALLSKINKNDIEKRRLLKFIKDDLIAILCNTKRSLNDRRIERRRFVLKAMKENENYASELTLYNPVLAFLEEPLSILINNNDVNERTLLKWLNNNEDEDKLLTSIEMNFEVAIGISDLVEMMHRKNSKYHWKMISNTWPHTQLCIKLINALMNPTIWVRVLRLLPTHRNSVVAFLSNITRKYERHVQPFNLCTNHDYYSLVGSEIILNYEKEIRWCTGNDYYTFCKCLALIQLSHEEHFFRDRSHLGQWLRRLITPKNEWIDLKLPHQTFNLLQELMVKYCDIDDIESLLTVLLYWLKELNNFDIYLTELTCFFLCLCFPEFEPYDTAFKLQSNVFPYIFRKGYISNTQPLNSLKEKTFWSHQYVSQCANAALNIDQFHKRIDLYLNPSNVLMLDMKLPANIRKY